VTEEFLFIKPQSNLFLEPTSAELREHYKTDMPTKVSPCYIYLCQCAKTKAIKLSQKLQTNNAL